MDFLSLLATKPSLPSYGGGSNPAIIYVVAGLIALVIASVITVFVKKQLRNARFHRLLAAADVTSEELGILKSFIKRFNIHEPLPIAESRAAFNQLMDRIAHHYEYTRLSEEAMIREIQVFDRIRRKLGFLDTLEGNACKNTRALPVDHSLLVTFTDTATHESFTFRSRILANYDFFLGIEPPEKAINREAFDQKRPSIHVAFDIEDGGHYTFDTKYQRMVNYPETMWCLQHSSKLSSTEIDHPLNIPSIVMVSSEEEQEVTEVSGVLMDLTNKDCRFTPGSQDEQLEIGSGVLVSFDINGESFMCRGSIADSHQFENNRNYLMTFSGLSEEEQKALVRFAHGEKKKAKQGSS